MGDFQNKKIREVSLTVTEVDIDGFALTNTVSDELRP